jgi:adenylate cyclase
VNGRVIDRISFWAGWVIVAAGVAMVLAGPAPVPIARDLVFDSYARAAPRAAPAKPTLVIDIDDESLARLGQWPWPRDRVAEMVDRLTASGARAIGFDVLFAEPDRASPRRVLSAFSAEDQAIADLVAHLPDTDLRLAEAMARSRVVLGVAFSTGDGSTEPPRRNAEIKVAGGEEAQAIALVAGTGPVAVQPIAPLAEAAKGIGTINISPASDKVVRSVPLLVGHSGRLYPSLSVETLRVARRKQAIGVDLDPDGRSIAAVRISGLERPIDTDPNGGLRLHFRALDMNRYVPAWRLLAGEVPAERFADAIVLVGSSAKGLLDMRFSPLGLIPGVEAHAQAIDQMVEGGWLARPYWAPLCEATFLIAAALVLAWVIPRSGPGPAAAGTLALALAAWAASWSAFRSNDLLLDPLVPSVVLVVFYLVRSLGRHLAAESERRWIREAFSSYVSPNLVRHLIDNPEGLRLGGERRDCSFVMTDLAGFTTLVEKQGPEQVVRLLNQYIEGMVGVAFRHGGTIDRIVGDGIAVLFSAPVVQPDHKARALACALEMDGFSQGFAAARRAEGLPVGITRIGVHSGSVIVGNVGGGALMDYRALGDAINTAARLETANGQLGTRMAVSAAILEGCPDASVRPIGTLVLKGKTDGIETYEPVPPDLPALEPYRAAFARMAAGAPDAAQAFADLAARYPEDKLVAFHAARLARGETGAVIRFTEK